MILSFSYDVIKLCHQLKYLGGASGTAQLLQSNPSVIIELRDMVIDIILFSIISI